MDRKKKGVNSCCEAEVSFPKATSSLRQLWLVILRVANFQAVDIVAQKQGKPHLNAGIPFHPEYNAGTDLI
jgi:hypothetical protein